MARERALSRSVSPPRPSWARGGTLKRSVSARHFHGQRDTREAGRIRPLPRTGPRRSDPGTEWSAFDYGMHSLRIGRENGLRAADVRPELINDITSHTSMRGRQAYSRAEVAELVTASRLADSVVARPVEKAVSFGA